MKRLLSGLVGLIVLTSLSVAWGQVVDADPNRGLHVTPQSGNYLICVTSFHGKEAALLANDMVQVIRHDYKLPAYVFDKGKQEREQQKQEFMKRHELCPEGRFRGVRIEEQYAVLVGGYKDMESARDALEGIRKLKPPPDRFCTTAKRVRPGKSDKGEDGIFIEEVRFNPFNTAFVSANPSIERKNDFQSEAADPLLKKLNAGESLSVLNCPKKYSLVVKSFYGAMAIQPVSGGSKLMEMLGWGKSGDQLNASALQARQLADVLRAQRFEAYVMHMRGCSLVTVGGYDDLKDPQLALNQRALANMRITQGKSGTGPVLMELMAQPVPMEIPRPQ